MLLRSGTIKNNKCKKCNEFHAYNKFKYLCSNCFQKQFPLLAEGFRNPCVPPINERGRMKVKNHPES